MSALFLPSSLSFPLRLWLGLAPLVLGFGIDLVLGDPRWFPHPVVWMGRAIQLAEPLLRRLFPKTPGGERLAGRLLGFFLPLGSFGLSFFAIWLAGRWGGWGWALGLESLWCWQALALRDLKAESMAVYFALKAQGLAAARRALGRIVGRETDSLPEAGVLRATVETVAENLSDGVIAPLFYMALGGAPLALWYKAVNTLDSMVGYKTSAYLNFGRFSARMDDAANLLPSRLSAFLLMGAAFVLGCDSRGAFRVWKRDRRCHASPNSAQTESACAGAMGLCLGGDAVYFGQLVHKPTLGQARRPICPEDIPLACRLLYGSSFLGLALALLLRGLLLWAVFLA